MRKFLKKQTNWGEQLQRYDSFPDITHNRVLTIHCTHLSINGLLLNFVGPQRAWINFLPPPASIRFHLLRKLQVSSVVAICLSHYRVEILDYKIQQLLDYQMGISGITDKKRLASTTTGFGNLFIYFFFLSSTFISFHVISNCLFIYLFDYFDHF